MSLRMNIADLADAFRPEVVRRAEEIVAGGGIRQVDISLDGQRVNGSVKGGAPKPYQQNISISRRHGRTRVVGYCSCPVTMNCKHVAAVLLHALAGEIAEGNGYEHEEDDDFVVGQANAVGSGAQAQASRSRILSPTPSPAQSARAARQEQTGASSGAAGLSPATRVWLDRLAAAAAIPERAARSTGAGSSWELFYVLDRADAGSAAGRTTISPVVVQWTADGRPGQMVPFDFAILLRPAERFPKYLSDDDLDLLKSLYWLAGAEPGMPQKRATQDVPLGPDRASLRVLQGALATGRLRHRALDGRALAAGPAVRAVPTWTAAGANAQRLSLTPISDGAGAAAAAAIDCCLTVAPPHYLDEGRALVGAIETDLPAALAVELAAAPAVPASQALLVQQQMRERLPARRRVESAVAEAASLAAAPPAEAATAAAAVAGTLLPLPQAPANMEVRRVRPVPRLELMMVEAKLRQDLRWYSSNPSHAGTFKVPSARLSFSYGSEVVAVAATSETVEQLEDGRLVLMPRDHAFELEAAQNLASRDFRALKATPLKVDKALEGDLHLMPSKGGDGYAFLQTFEDPARFIAFGEKHVPELVKAGWQVLYADDYPYRIAEGEAAWWADVGEGSGIDWFAFELGIEFEGHRINLVSSLADIIARLPAQIAAAALSEDADGAFAGFCRRLKFYHTLPDGRLLPLPGERLAPLLKSLLELIGPRSGGDNGQVRLHRADAAALAKFAGNSGMDVAWAASAERLLELGRSLQAGRGPLVVRPPKSFKACLRPYQGDGLNWIEFLRESGFGGVLADDMGLGKTVQALAFLAREKAEGRLDRPALIVAPTSVLPNWQAEAERFTPELRVLALRGLDRRQLFADIRSHDLVLTTYPLLVRDHEKLLAEQFHVAILDEAQAIKNAKTTMAQLAHRIDARHRLALTGTPLENNLGEVWSLFQFLAPGLLGDETTFRRTFRTPIEKHGDQAAQAFLSRRLKPFMLRRTKQEVAKELPPKTEIIERIRLEGGQRDLYETVRSLMHERVREEIARKGLAKSHIVFLDALLKLRQVCCDPRLLKLAQARRVMQSAKLERLMEMIPELVGEGRRILLFSQFTSMLALIEAELAALNIPYVILTGSTTDRATPVKAFQSGKVPLFLLSLKAGGTGLNLTAADTVIHYDPWWNPAVENQATDRAYRIGQDKPVFVHKLIVEEGIEEAIEQLKARKAALAEALFAGSSRTGLDITEADVQALFAPLGARPREGRQGRRAA